MMNCLSVTSHRWLIAAVLMLTTSLPRCPNMGTVAHEHKNMSEHKQPAEDGSGHPTPCPRSARLLPSSACLHDDEDCHSTVGSGSTELETMAQDMPRQQCRFENGSLGIVPMSSGKPAGEDDEVPTPDSGHHKRKPGENNAPNPTKNNTGKRSNPHHPSLYDENRLNGHSSNHGNNMAAKPTNKNRNNDTTGLAIAVSVGAFHFVLTVLIIVVVFRHQKAVVQEKGCAMDKSEPVITAVSLEGGRHQPLTTVMPSPTSVKHAPQNDYEESPVRDVGVEKSMNARTNTINMDV